MSPGSGPVAGARGNPAPCLFVDFIGQVADTKTLAATRAAEPGRSSTQDEPERGAASFAGQSFFVVGPPCMHRSF